MDSFNLNNIGPANLQIAGFDPVSFSAFGMLIVFCGLIIISLYIYLLPKLLDFASQCKKKIKSKKTSEENSEKAAAKLEENEILTAIATAFHLDQNFPEENQRITWLSHGLDESAWMASGISQGIARRHSLHITRRKF